MHQYSLDVNEAIMWAHREHQKFQEQYHRLIEELPQFSPEIDKDLKEYIVGLSHLVRGNVAYSFESARYFEDGLKVQETRQVALSPQVAIKSELKLERN
jgi:hypothetical protein